ncbi:MAG TPA: hypothetical protein PKM22_04405, partial [Candidatus Hydrogenedentes bacterium]|nr:hypothetical protein [Candidatus Hydrogenedentota bacterium]
DQFSFVGNTSLARAPSDRAAARARAEAISCATRHFDLSGDPEFQTEFAMAMFFPDSPPDEAA